MKSWLRWSAWLALSLLLWTVAAESTHNHLTRTEAASCSICVAAHSASPAPHSFGTKPVFAAVGLLREEAVIASPRFDFSDLIIRGPPAL